MGFKPTSLFSLIFNSSYSKNFIFNRHLYALRKYRKCLMRCFCKDNPVVFAVVLKAEIHTLFSYKSSLHYHFTNFNEFYNNFCKILTNPVFTVFQRGHFFQRLEGSYEIAYTAEAHKPCYFFHCRITILKMALCSVDSVL